MNGTPDRAAPTERRALAGRRITDRQAVILDLVAAGLENKQIAGRLGISEQAVKEHVSSLLRRLRVSNRAALAEAAAIARIVGTTDVDPQWLDLLFRTAPLMIALLEGPEHRFVAANDRYAVASAGRSLLGRSFREAYPELNPDGIVRLLDEAFATGEPRASGDIPASWYPPGSAELMPGYVRALVQPFRGPDGIVRGTALFVADVSAEVRAREDARAAALEQAAVLAQLPIGVVSVDLEGRITLMNDAARRILRLGDADPLGTGVWEVASAVLEDGDTLAREQWPLHRALRGEHGIPGTYTVRLPCGEHDVRVRASARPLYDAAGKIRGAVAVFSEEP